MKETEIYRKKSPLQMEELTSHDNNYCKITLNKNGLQLENILPLFCDTFTFPGWPGRPKQCFKSLIKLSKLENTLNKSWKST